MARHLKRTLVALSALHWAMAMPAAGESGFPPEPAPAPEAPNVLVIMTDDVGFAASTTFGGGIPTPTLDRLAASGLVYNNFYTTSICSPTRAALLTGRNHHAVGFGTVSDLARPGPGYNSVIPKSAATIAQILSASGYDTAMFGKNHNIPTWQSGPLGPYDQWAMGLGFRYFYGFNGGWTDQFAPQLVEDTRMVDPPAPGDGTESGYVFDRDMADHAITWLRTQHSQHPDRPFLLYYAPGTAHAPLQAPAEWIARFRGKFDAGWDAYREATLARQKKLGIVPADTKLAPMPTGTRPWSELTVDERKLAARYMEVYAAMLAYCDTQIGRVIDELEQAGELDNTLVVFIQGDNGASGEGGRDGGYNYATRVSAAMDGGREAAHALSHLDEIGGPESLPIAPVGWASALNTPFPYYKLVASRLGGVRNGMVVSWPARLKQRGLRRQFVDVTDVTPTILEAAGVEPPDDLNGVAQQPFDGVSFAYSFTQPKEPSRHRTQYFEIFGHAAIYHDGWLLAERVKVDPRVDAGFPDPEAPWQLYDLSKDFSQTSDVAAAHPEKVAELAGLWRQEAVRNHVLPIVKDNLRSMLPGTRPEPLSEPGHHVLYPSDLRFPEGVFPAINNRSWSIEADLVVPAGGAEGVIITQGGRFSGWALAMFSGAPTFLYRTGDREDTLVRLAGPPLSPGHHKVTVSFTIDGPGFGRGGDVVLGIDGQIVASGRLERTVPFKFTAEDGMVGRDTGTAVTEDYQVPFTFTGRLNSVTVDLEPVQPFAHN